MWFMGSAQHKFFDVSYNTRFLSTVSFQNIYFLIFVIVFSFIKKWVAEFHAILEFSMKETHYIYLFHNRTNRIYDSIRVCYTRICDHDHTYQIWFMIHAQTWRCADHTSPLYTAYIIYIKYTIIVCIRNIVYLYYYDSIKFTAKSMFSVKIRNIKNASIFIYVVAYILYIFSNSIACEPICREINKINFRMKIRKNIAIIFWNINTLCEREEKIKRTWVSLLSICTLYSMQHTYTHTTKYTIIHFYL